MSVSQWRRLLPAFSASPGLCCRSFLCLTEHWTELESEKEPPRKRKCLSLRKKAIRARPANWRRRTAPSGSLSLRDVSLERRLTSLSVSFLRHCQALKTPPLKSTMHGDDWIVQTDLLAIDVGHVVRVVALYEAFAQEAD